MMRSSSPSSVATSEKKAGSRSPVTSRAPDRTAFTSADSPAIVISSESRTTPSAVAMSMLPPDFKGDPRKNIWGKSVDAETQGRYLVEGYERARAEWPWMGVMFVWHLRNRAATKVNEPIEVD